MVIATVNTTNLNSECDANKQLLAKREWKSQISGRLRYETDSKRFYFAKRCQELPLNATVHSIYFKADGFAPASGQL